MVINVTNDPLAAWEDDRRQEQAKSGAAPFFFSLKEGQRALVHFLLDYRDAPNCTMDYHKHYDNATKEWVGNNVCAAPFGLKCVLCEKAAATKNKRLAAFKSVFLPVYLHSIKERKGGEWVSVTYQEDGVDRPVSGVRMLDMRYTSSSILDALSLAFSESSDDVKERTITNRDFIIARSGAGLDTKYTVTPATRAPLALPSDLPRYDAAKVRDEVETHRPPVLPADLVGSNGEDDKSSGSKVDHDPFLSNDFDGLN